MIDFRGLADFYEDLRSYVLGEATIFSHPPGLDLFLKKGFLNWAKAQKGKVQAKPFRTTECKESYQQSTEREITLILANMVLEERRRKCISLVG